MARFSYIASDNKGEAIRGFIEAPSKNDVAKLLSSKGLFLNSCKLSGQYR